MALDRTGSTSGEPLSLLDVHSALDADGLTTALSAALATAGIAATVLTGHFNDSILVPADRVDDATACLTELSDTA